MDVVNMTATFSVRDRVDIIQLLLDQYMHAKLNKGFRALSLKLLPGTKDRCTALVYESGSIVIIGARSRGQIRHARRYFLGLVKGKAGKGLKIHNIVYTFLIGHRINLYELYTRLKENKNFCEVFLELELFPALSVRLSKRNTSATVFHNGRVNITGCKAHKEALLMKVRLLANL